MTSVAEFVETLKRLGLLPPDQLDALAREQSRFPDNRSCAIELNRRGWLTFFQVDLLIAGKGDELRLGPYVLLERLGEGTLGPVFKARHSRMGRVVALKIIRKDRLQKPADVERFHREIEAVAQLSHANTVQAYAADQVGDTHYFAMEFVEGLDLSKRVKHRGPLAVLEACEYIRQAALGLQHAHERGLVHGDLKPSNLIVYRPGQSELPVVKILDLGLAGEVGARFTRDSADFVAPEQTTSPARTDAKSDLYSLGCTFYFMLAGKPPFPEGSVADKLEKHRQQEPVPIEKVRGEVSAAVAGIIRKLMAKRSEDRFVSAQEVAQALGELREPASALTWQNVLAALKRGLVIVLVQLYRLARAHPRWAAGCLLILIVLLVWVRVPGEKTERPHAVLGYTLRKHPPQAARFGGHWYLFVPERVRSWEEAQERCQQMGGYLACVTSAEENNFLLDITGENNFWLGGRNDEQQKWFWITGEPFTFTSWANGQPNNGANVYLEMYRGNWHDIGAREKRAYAAGFVCEFDF